MYRRALADREKLLGINHPYTLTSVNNLGIVLENKESTRRLRQCINRPWQAVRNCWGSITITP